MFKVLGWDESFNACDCCGKAPLKGTFTVTDENGDLLHYGSTCVTRNTGKTKLEITTDIKAHEAEREEAARKEYAATGLESAYEAKREEARANGFTFGKVFADYCRSAAEAARNAKREIASKYNVSTAAL